jgi:hypothetical protein
MSTPPSNHHAPSNVTTLVAATANVLNLANPGRVFYANQDVYTQRDFERKIDWLGGRIAALNADILTVQEVWDDAALKAAVSHSGLRYSTVVVPGAENDDKNNGGDPASAPRGGAVHTPRVGIITRLDVDNI